MKHRIQTQHKIHAPIERLWANISKASEVHTWLPVIVTCSLQGQGEGAKRICGSAQGELLEMIIKVDHNNKVFQYAVDKQPFFPIQNILGTMTLHDKKEYAELEWELEFNIDDTTLLPMIEEAVRGMYVDGAAGLENISN